MRSLNFRYRRWVAKALLGVGYCASVWAGCTGKIPDPVSDLCWNCFFPIEMGGATMGTGPDSPPKAPAVCACPAPPPVFLRPGIGMSYWSPDRVAEMVRTPLCSPTLGGVVLGHLPVSDGDDVGRQGSGGNRKSQGSFYQMHWMDMPVFEELGVATAGSLCMKDSGISSFVWLSELDPLWDDDQLAFALAPEALLFANIPATLACTADAVKASVSDFGWDSLFWCSVGEGSVYPLSGHKQYHTGGVDTAMNLVHRITYRLHRTGLLSDTSTVAAMCQDLPQPVLRKGQYKVQFMFPLPDVLQAHGFGVPSSLFETGKEYPVAGEDWSMLIWRKHLCCAL